MHARSRELASFTPPRTLHPARLSHSERDAGTRLAPPVVGRPKTRSECPDERPCPWAGCRHHLAVDVNPQSGGLKLNFPGVDEGDFSAVPETCSLDVADRGGVTLERVGELLNITRERARQIEDKARAAMKKASSQ